MSTIDSARGEGRPHPTEGVNTGGRAGFRCEGKGDLRRRKQIGRRKGVSQILLWELPRSDISGAGDGNRTKTIGPNKALLPAFSSIGVKWSEVGHLAATSCQIIGFAVFCPVKQTALVADGMNDPGITGRQA